MYIYLCTSILSAMLEDTKGPMELCVCLSTRQDEDLSFLSPFNFPPSSSLCPLSSFTFTLHPAGVDLVASDGWQGSDAVYRIGLRGLAVSAVCKVASAV